MHDGVELTAYLVNESRARRSELAGDPLARQWIPEREQAQVRGLWEEFAGAVYPDDDLVVALRCRCIIETLAQTLGSQPDTVLVACGAGFSSYPWLLPFQAAVEVDLPRIIEAKQRRAAELTAAGVIEQREVTHLVADLTDPAARAHVVERVRVIAAGRPIVYVAEGLVFYLPADDARAVTGLGAAMSDDPVSVVSYWPAAAAGNRVLAAQRDWFRRHSVPEQATYLTIEDLTEVLGRKVENHSLHELQERYLGSVTVPEADLIPEHTAVAGA